MDWAVILAVFLLAILVIVVAYFSLKKGKKQPKQSRKSRSRRAEKRARASGLTFTTMRGVSVKSGAEKMIADYLTKNNIDYKYEPVLLGGPNNDKQMRPDFYLLDYEVYVEFWGMADYPDKEKRAEYAEKMQWKLEQYREQNIEAISLYPDDVKNLEETFPQKFEEATGRKFPVRSTS